MSNEKRRKSFQVSLAPEKREIIKDAIRASGVRRSMAGYIRSAAIRAAIEDLKASRETWKTND